MKFPDYYKRLGLRKNATKEEIKKAFRQLALQYHPDRNKNPDAAQRFIEVNEAYLILYDDEARQKYDREYDYHYREEYVAREEPSYQYDYSQNNSTVFNDPDLNNWSNKAREQGNEYANMTFDDFSKMVLGFVKETGFHLGNTLLYYVGILLAMGGCGNLVIGLTSKGEIGNPVIGIIILPIGIIIWRLAQKNWDKH